jgi:Cell wall synthesis protein CwsA
MSSSTDSRLTSGQRLGRGLKYTALGPVDVTRGALGLGVSGAHSSASWVGDRYRRGRLKEQLSKDLAAVQETLGEEFAAAQEVVSNLPQSLKKARARRRRRPLLWVALGAATLAGGAVAFSLIRRSSRAEEAPVRPPSVEVTPRP